MFDPHWISSDDSVHRFFSRLEESAFPGKVPESFRAFRRQCELRERAGRETFGLKYLSRKNCAEAVEEAADLALYMYLDVLKHLRDAENEDDIELALTGAFHAYQAFCSAHELAAKRRGAP